MVKSLHSTEYEKFRYLIQEARENSGLTQSQLASRLGKPQSYVSKYESGERRIDVVEFVKICNVIGVDADKLLNRLTGRRDK